MKSIPDEHALKTITLPVSDLSEKSHFMKQVLLWNFHGPSARPTAQHFEKHLRDFLAREHVHAQTAQISDSPGHAGIVCLCDNLTATHLEKALRPQGRCQEDEFIQAYTDTSWV